MIGKKAELLESTLDTLILKALFRAPLDGHGIIQRTGLISDQVLAAEQASRDRLALAKVRHLT